LQSSSEEKRKPYAISTDVKKLWKAGPFLRLSSGFGILARAGTLYFAPVAPRAARLELSAHEPPLSVSAGLSLIGA
jgi:hypothetical protein